MVFEGFAFLDGDGLAFDFFTIELHDDAVLFLVIQREVSVFLEDANFPEFIAADAAGGDVGYAAVFEAEADIGDVFTFAEDGDADGVHAEDGGADEVEDDFDIMNH